MRRLIFGWYLVSLTLIVAIVLAALLWSGPVAFRMVSQLFARGLMGYAALQGAITYEEHGVAALAELTLKSMPSPGSSVAFFNQSGENLLAAKVPERVMRIVQKIQGTEGLEVETSAGVASLVVGTKGPSGRGYVLAIQIPSGELIWSLIDWRAWSFRMGLVLIAAIVVCSWLASKLTIPLAQLSGQTRRFAAGDLSVRSTRGLGMKIPEMQQLADDFDHMAERIESLLRSQKELMHHVSHELRTPLTRLQLAISAAENQGASVSGEVLSRISREGERLNELLDQILRYSKLEATAALPAVQPIDWTDFLESIAADASFEATAESKQVTIGEMAGGKFLGDRDLLRSAFENVIRNAIRHSPEGGEVLVEQVEVEGGGWEVAVRDRGPGVDAQQLGKIFEPFYRAAGMQSGPRGYGLGLAIAKRVAMMHQASVVAERRPGGGLSVRFRFPATT